MTRRRIVFLALLLAGLTAILLSALYLRYRRPVSVIKELAVCTADGSLAAPWCLIDLCGGPGLEEFSLLYSESGQGGRLYYAPASNAAEAAAVRERLNGSR